MQVNSVTSQDNVNSAANNGSTSGNNPSTAMSGLDSLANENTFMQLLVSQIKNQDPLNPTDSVQFLGQLTQLSQLEQLVGIKQMLSQSQTAAGSSNANGTSQTTN